MLDAPKSKERRGLRDPRFAAITRDAIRAAAESLIAWRGGERVRSRAVVELADGATVVLVRGPDGSWRLEGGALAVPALEEPRDAIRALRLAVERRDLRGIEETLARETREAWETEARRVVEQTLDLDALRIEVRGDRATVTSPDGLVIELVRDSAEWRVLDVRPGR